MSPSTRSARETDGANTEGPRRVLLVEDEMLLAMQMTDMLEAMGFDVVSAGTLQRGLALTADDTYCCGVLDLNLSGQSVYPIADALRRRGIPLIFTTGYERTAVRADYREGAILCKPFTIEMLDRALQQALRAPADMRSVAT